MTGVSARGTAFGDWLAHLLSSGDGLFVCVLAVALVLLVWWVICSPPNP